MKKIAFQGRRGAYSESAALHLFGEGVEVVPMNTFEEVFRSVESGAVDGGAIPIENSTAGSVYENFDLSYKWRLPIVAELFLQISHCLCVVPGTKIEDLREVLSHPQGLAQCSRFFGRHPHIKSTAFFDTAGSAEEVARRGDKSVGAIASVYAAKYYGLEVLAEGIENIPGVNYTLFYAIQKEAISLPFAGTVAAAGNDSAGGVAAAGSHSAGPVKTALIFTLQDSGKSGALYEALGCFAKRNLNLLRIESRPHPDRPWEFIFYLSFEGNPKDPVVIEALQELQNVCDFVYRLGSFYEGKTVKLNYKN